MERKTWARALVVISGTEWAKQARLDGSIGLWSLGAVPWLPGTWLWAHYDRWIVTQE